MARSRIGMAAARTAGVGMAGGEQQRDGSGDDGADGGGGGAPAPPVAVAAFAAVVTDRWADAHAVKVSWTRKAERRPL